MTLLQTIDSPYQLRKLSPKQLPDLALDIREFLLNTLNQCGGHFGASLGAVELTLALHYVFDTPYDQLIWDVGHQAYPHKILTGRRHLLHTIRQKEGLAPFPKREESPYDHFTVGHSSTSISSALGMCIGKGLYQKDHKTIAIIGDGGMTAGMAFEALNHAGSLNANIIVVLNDNDMSISRNVGALSNYFARILSSKLYSTVHSGGKKILSRIPPVWEFARKTETLLKGMVVPGILFEELGFNYIGPIDGHDLPILLKTLTNIKSLEGPQLLHVITKKGKGYLPAESEPTKYHAVNKGYLKNPKDKLSILSQTQQNITFSEGFGNWLCDMAALDPNLIAITPAMCEGSGMVAFQQKYPKRYFDVGIAEQHSVTFAAGLACEKTKPVVAIYSSFLQRAYDQLIHDVALQNLPVLFAIDRAGLVGGDGSTHHGSFDLSFLRCIPNMVIMAPSDVNELRHMLYTGFHCQGPAAVRYPRGTAPLATPLDTHMDKIPLGKAQLISQGKTNIALLAFGTLLHPAKEVAKRLNATLVNMRFIKPLDEALLLTIAKSHDVIVTIEENAIMGGAGSFVNEFLLSQNIQKQIINCGLQDCFYEHGTQAELLESAGLTVEGILETIQKRMGEYVPCKITQKVLQFG